MIVRKFSAIAVLSGIFATTVPGVAFANSDFCGSAKNCEDIKVYNRSSALVTSVSITQEKTDGACSLDDRNFSKNLAGVNDNGDAESITVKLNTDCKYKFKYKTTSGCAGDKTDHISPGNFSAGRYYVQLKGACGSLKTSTGPT